MITRHRDRGGLSSPKVGTNATIFSGIAARVHKRGDTLDYQQPDGTTSHETRDRAELKNIAKQIIGKPVHVNHDLSAKVGRVVDAHLDGDVLVADFRIGRADAQELLRQYPELSLGYQVDVAGDGSQHNTIVHELSIVERARCGAVCSTKLDANYTDDYSDAFSQETEAMIKQDCPCPTTRRDAKKMCSVCDWVEDPDDDDEDDDDDDEDDDEENEDDLGPDDPDPRTPPQFQMQTSGDSADVCPVCGSPLVPAIVPTRGEPDPDDENSRNMRRASPTYTKPSQRAARPGGPSEYAPDSDRRGPASYDRADADEKAAMVAMQTRSARAYLTRPTTKAKTPAAPIRSMPGRTDSTTARSISGPARRSR